MSYSRWSNSVWYTYYDVSSGDTLNSQVFTECGTRSFTYGELRADIEKCLDACEPESIDERDELRGYMQSFMEDAELRFNVG